MSPKIRQSAYYLSSALLYILGLIQVWFAVKTGGDIADVITGAGTLIGGTAPHYAGYKTGAQIKGGTFDDVAPADQVINGVQAAIQAATVATQAKADAEASIEQIKQVVSNVIGATPIIGPLAQQVIDSLPKV